MNTLITWDWLLRDLSKHYGLDLSSLEPLRVNVEPLRDVQRGEQLGVVTPPEPKR